MDVGFSYRIGRACISAISRHPAATRAVVRADHPPPHTAGIDASHLGSLTAGDETNRAELGAGSAVDRDVPLGHDILDLGRVGGRVRQGAVRWAGQGTQGGHPAATRTAVRADHPPPVPVRADPGHLCRLSLGDKTKDPELGSGAAADVDILQSHDIADLGRIGVQVYRLRGGWRRSGKTTPGKQQAMPVQVPVGTAGREQDRFIPAIRAPARREQRAGLIDVRSEDQRRVCAKQIHQIPGRVRCDRRGRVEQAALELFHGLVRRVCRSLRLPVPDQEAVVHIGSKRAVVAGIKRIDQHLPELGKIAGREIE